MSNKAIVIGASAGGFTALRTLLPMLPADFSIPILIVQHLSPSSDSYMPVFLNKISDIRVKEADEKEQIIPGTAYMAPPNYHLLVEEDKSLSLSNESKVNYSRPSIDILFETASFAYDKELIGIVLTGANNDGAQGLLQIKKAGGYCICQLPDEAETEAMPIAAIELAKPQKILSIENIGNLLLEIDKKEKLNI